MLFCCGSKQDNVRRTHSLTCSKYSSNMCFTSKSGMNDVTDVPSLPRVQRGKEAATYFDLYSNVHLFISITVLHPCFPLLFHARLHALFIHGPKPRLQAVFILVGSTQFGDYYINTMYCSQCSINSAYCKHLALTSPGWCGKPSLPSSTQPVTLRIQCHVQCKYPDLRSSTDSLLQ